MNDTTKIRQLDTRNVFMIAALTCFSALLAGCGPSLSFEKQYSLTAGEIIALPIDPAGVEQTIQVSANSTDGAKFAVHVYLAKDETAIETAITLGSDSDLILANSSQAPTANLSAKVPANEASVVRLSTEGNAATVNVAIKN